MRQAIRKAKVAFPTAVITSVAWLGAGASGSAGHKLATALSTALDGGVACG